MMFYRILEFMTVQHCSQTCSVNSSH